VSCVIRRTVAAAAPRPLARRLAPLAAAAAALGLAGCQLTSPIQTDVPYQSADGVSVDLDQVQIRNLLVVTQSEGAAGTVSGAVVNRADQPATITFAAESGASATVQVPAFGEQQITDATLNAVSAAPGAMLALQVGTAGSSGSVVQVPVLLPEGYYETPAG
jgi:hypothetical protein